MRISGLALLLAFFILGFDQSVNAQFVEERSIDTLNMAEREDQKMMIKVYDADTKKPVESDVIIKGINARKPIVYKAVTDTSVIIKHYRRYSVSVVQKGYMYYAHKFWPDEDEVHQENVALQPLEVGASTTIEDIVFMGDEVVMHSKSSFALNELVNFMKLNEDAKILITGHANGPKNDKGRSEKSPAFYRKASEQRAEAVRDYLINHGIQADRLATEGKGNSEMIFPDPKTDWETQMNRRVEIEIIGL